jgi:hypothetical protein
MSLFLSTFFTVFLLGFQQQNVTHGHYWAAAGTSIAIAGAQYTMIDGVAHGGNWMLMGIGGACGVTLSMWLHKRLLGKKSLRNSRECR